MFSLALPALSLIVRPSLHSRAGAPRCASGNEIRCAAADELTTDVVVVGSGLGGLSCAAMLAKYGHDVSVFEAHTIAGGCAHSFERDGYTFDSGPSLWAGCAAPSTNPLRQVLDAVGESPEWVQYDGWWMYTETGEYYAQSGDEAAFKKLIASRGGGGGAVAEWEKLREFLKPMATSVFAVPPVALRGDPGALLTVLPWLKAFANPLIGLRARFLQGPWSDVLDAANVHDAFLRNWFDFLAFAFSGLPSDGTIAAAMTSRSARRFASMRAQLWSTIAFARRLCVRPRQAACKSTIPRFATTKRILARNARRPVWSVLTKRAMRWTRLATLSNRLRATKSRRKPWTTRTARLARAKARRAASARRRVCATIVQWRTSSKRRLAAAPRHQVWTARAPCLALRNASRAR